MMSGSRLAAILGLMAGAAAAQTEIGLSSGAVRSAGSALLVLYLHSLSGAAPAAIQWSFEYPSSDVDIVSIQDGPAATVAQKTVLCAKNVRGCTCLAVGPNAAAIPDGVVAGATVTLAPGVRATTILVTNALAASAGGDMVPLATANGTVTVADSLPFLLKRQPPHKRGPAGK